MQATLARLKQEKTPPAGAEPRGAERLDQPHRVARLRRVRRRARTANLKDFGGRFDIDVQLLWEFQALGFGNRARVDERRAEYEAATLDLFRTQDRIAAEVATRSPRCAPRPSA